MYQPSNILPISFYENPDVVAVSRQLLGKVICSSAGSEYTSGIIIETEAYCGRDDKACHANNGKRTPRTEVMYGEPGHAYIYLCYGIHHLFNVVTNRPGLADAVLIRAIKPIEGVDTMKERRNIQEFKNLSDGPGKLTRAMGITTSLNKKTSHHLRSGLKTGDLKSQRNLSPVPNGSGLILLMKMLKNHGASLSHPRI
jgi:DNA-3-methyladenine glycosylase